MNRKDGKEKNLGIAKCPTCGNEFKRESPNQKYCNRRCRKSRQPEWDRQWRRNHPDNARNSYLKYAYGITLNEYNALLDAQDFKCAICGKPAKNEKKNLGVDHNHKTKYVRGLLCSRCNYAVLGNLKDKKKLWVGLRDYITKALQEDAAWEN